MKGQDILNKLEETGRVQGASAVGFADLEPVPEAVRHGFTQAVSVVVRLNRGVINQIGEAPTHAYYAHYVAVNQQIDRITLAIAQEAESFGFLAQAIPAGPPILYDENGPKGLFQHKTAAVLSGMGWIGKSALFLHRDYGSGVRLGTVLLASDLPISNAPMESCCRECTICQTRCPAGAIRGTLWKMGMSREALLDARTCDAYIETHHREVAHGMVCGLCMAHCPYTRRG